jgi:hypothetical protein
MFLDTFICAHPVISVILVTPILVTVPLFTMCAIDDNLDLFFDMYSNVFKFFKFFFNLITGKKKKEHIKEVYREWVEYEVVETIIGEEPEADMNKLGAERQNLGRDYVYHNRNKR